jgi:acyl-CoA thioesterase
MDSTDVVREKDAFARLLGIEVVESGPGRAKVRMAVTPGHRNGLGMVHGGAMFTLADYAFAVACNSHGYAAVAINANISYLKAPKGGVLWAEAEELAVEGKMGSCQVRVLDEDGSVVAMFGGLSYRKSHA